MIFAQVAVCNLASLALPRFVTADREFDFEKSAEVTRVKIETLAQQNIPILFTRLSREI